MSKGQTVECMTVRHFTEGITSKVEVWVGSGQSDDLSAQVTIIDLSDMGVEVNRLPKNTGLIQLRKGFGWAYKRGGL